LNSLLGDYTGLNRISLRDSFRFVLRNDIFLYLAALWGAILGLQTLSLMYLLSPVSTKPGEYIDPGNYLSYFLLFMALTLLFGLALLFARIYAIRFTSSTLRKKREEIFSTVIGKIPGVTAIWLVLTFIYGIIILFAIGPFFISPALTCLTVPLALIVLFFIAIRLTFAVYPYVVDDEGIMDSIYRSWDITSGRVLDVFVFVLISGLPALPFMIIYAFIPEQYFYLKIGLNFFIAYFSLVGIVNITRGYMELASEHIRQDVWAPPRPYAPKPVFAFGIRDYDINRLRGAGIYVIPISFRAEQARVADMIGYADFYAGDSAWYPRKVIFMHGMSEPEMRHVMNTASSILGGDVIFGSSRMSNMDMSVRQLLDALLREHESQKL